MLQTRDKVYQAVVIYSGAMFQPLRLLVLMNRWLILSTIRRWLFLHRDRRQPAALLPPSLYTGKQSVGTDGEQVKETEWPHQKKKKNHRMRDAHWLWKCASSKEWKIRRSWTWTNIRIFSCTDLFENFLKQIIKEKQSKILKTVLEMLNTWCL